MQRRSLNGLGMLVGSFSIYNKYNKYNALKFDVCLHSRYTGIVHTKHWNRITSHRSGNGED